MGFKGFLDPTTPPKDSYEIKVTAQQWVELQVPRRARQRRPDRLPASRSSS